MPMGRYAALLVSLHGMGLYERFTNWKKSPDATPVVEAFLQQEKAFQQELIDRLAQDPACRDYVTQKRSPATRNLSRRWMPCRL